jgi:hypothetical protein
VYFLGAEAGADVPAPAFLDAGEQKMMAGNVVDITMRRSFSVEQILRMSHPYEASESTS